MRRTSGATLQRVLRVLIPTLVAKVTRAAKKVLADDLSHTRLDTMSRSSSRMAWTDHVEEVDEPSRRSALPLFAQVLMSLHQSRSTCVALLSSLCGPAFPPIPRRRQGHGHDSGVQTL
jgi:hypothetical protein